MSIYLNQAAKQQCSAAARLLTCVKLDPTRDR